MKPQMLPTSMNDRKHSTMDSEKGDAMPIRPCRPRNRPLVTGFAVVALCYLLWSAISRYNVFHHICGIHTATPVMVNQERALVPLEAHIMSKCPDAKDCLRMMVLPTMQRVIDKVNFTLSFIGTPTDNDGVECKHGPAECMGNIIELCAATQYPDPKTYLGFTFCMTQDYKDIPQLSLIQDCALEHGMDFEKLNECALKDDGGFGIELLRDSVRRSTAAGVTKSCTVRLNEEIYCVRDDGEWKDCPHGPGVNDLVLAVEKLYQSSPMV
ncbi:uncharacterized protein K444DRAFT_558334 [Hyaloscypha bicolor E]|uniref:Gamma interferon inducible lysosomal thiol reductase n=1 Tax=Hyaloscypha bicolor E TaxID=1095630 RepID=A0A2J6TIX4_9HELO|nr:uncharacterized protein K444DRAFT_558334 [Hyaloscypha bicolor E]PMD62953.1 hypothetical protein K444DRAFT_558334 [Hyaloscypha bicolor E]